MGNCVSNSRDHAVARNEALAALGVALVRRFPLAAVQRWTVAGMVDVDVTVTAGWDDVVRTWVASTATPRCDAIRLTITPQSDRAENSMRGYDNGWELEQVPNRGDEGLGSGGADAASLAASRMGLVSFRTFSYWGVAQRDLQRKYDTVYAEYDVVHVPHPWSHRTLLQLRAAAFAVDGLNPRFLAADEDPDTEVMAALGVPVRHGDPHVPFRQAVRGAGAIARVSTRQLETCCHPSSSTDTTWVVSSGGPSAVGPARNLSDTRLPWQAGANNHLSVDLLVRGAGREEAPRAGGVEWRAHGPAHTFQSLACLEGELGERLHLLTPKGERVVVSVTGLVHRLAYVPLAGWAQEVRQTLLLCRREDGAAWTHDAAGSVLASLSCKSVIGFATGLWTAADGTVSLTVTPAAVAETALVSWLKPAKASGCSVTWFMMHEHTGGAK